MKEHCEEKNNIIKATQMNVLFLEMGGQGLPHSPIFSQTPGRPFQGTPRCSPLRKLQALADIEKECKSLTERGKENDRRGARERETEKRREKQLSSPSCFQSDPKDSDRPFLHSLSVHHSFSLVAFFYRIILKVSLPLSRPLSPSCLFSSSFSSRLLLPIPCPISPSPSKT